MTFEQKYRALEDGFREQVARDEKRWPVNSAYLPNVEPSGPVNYVLIAMEPSSNGKSKDEILRQIEEEDYRNFCNSKEDFILHYCARNFLCRDGETYHVTDLAKGTVETKFTDADRRKRYEDWYPLLEEELRLVAPNAGIISIGKTAGEFLLGKCVFGHMCTILHYSPQAIGYRTKAICGRSEEFEEFASSHREIACGDSRWEPDSTFPLCKTDKELAFTYKVCFERCRNRRTPG